MADIYWVEDGSIPCEKNDRGRSKWLILDFGDEDYYTGFWDFEEHKWWIDELGDFVDFDVVVRWCDPNRSESDTENS